MKDSVKKLTSLRRNESKLLSEHTDEASLSSDSSRAILRCKCKRLNSFDPSSGDYNWKMKFFFKLSKFLCYFAIHIQMLI